MPTFQCPQCSLHVSGDDAAKLKCPRCGYGSSAPPFGAGSYTAPPGPPPAYQAAPTWGTAVPPGTPNPPGWGYGPQCPRCHSTYSKLGGIPTWAIVCAIVGFFVVCVLSLLFLIVKEENVCYNCGLHWNS